MKRSLACCALLAAAALPSCRSAAPRTGASATPAPEALSRYVGQTRVLRGKGDEATVKVDARRPLTGTCDVAVRVRGARFQKDGALFSLETLGRPRLASGEPRCRAIRPAVALLLVGATTASGDLARRVEAVLPTPEGYLAAHGVKFDRPAAPLPTAVATADPAGRPAESVLGRKVTAWPRPLLSVHPLVHDRSGRVRQESEIDFDAVVGTDGRLHQPVVGTGLTAAHKDALLEALSSWRYEPARTADGVVAARISSRVGFRIY